MTLFTNVHGSDNRSKVFRSSRFDLDKTKRFALQSNNVDLAAHLHALAVTAYRNSKIGQDKAKTILEKIVSSQRLAAFAKHTCAAYLRAFILVDDR